MRKSSCLPAFAALAALLVLLCPGPARADVAPPNSCNVAGQACNTAEGPSGSYTAAGTCVQTTCPHTGPTEDGSIGTTNEPCTLCMATDGGSSSSSSSGGSSSSGSSSGGSDGGSTGSSSKSGGCAISMARAQTLAPFGLMIAGAAILVASRRRRGR